MALEIATGSARAILTAAQRSTSLEVCGLLLGQGARVTSIVPADNVAARPETEFEIDPAALLAAHRAARQGGPTVIGHYHSHPTGLLRPSARDAAAAREDGAFWIIASGARLGCWRAVPSGPVEGRFVPVALRQIGDGCAALLPWAQGAEPFLLSLDHP